jgi:hypothetical protein
LTRQPTNSRHASAGSRVIGKPTSRIRFTASRNSSKVSAIPASGLASSGSSKPIARAMRLKHWNPPRRHSLAGTVGASSGASVRMSAAESSTASSEVTQEVSSRGERNLTSGRYVLWLSPTSAAQRSQFMYSSGSVLIVEPVPSP